jgi:hypothetical protein
MHNFEALTPRRTGRLPQVAGPGPRVPTLEAFPA